LFVVIVRRALWVPVHHDEAATFFYYIQTGDFLPYTSHVDANNHILNSALSYGCFKIFGDSTFAIRLPNIIAFLILAYGVFGLSTFLKNGISKIILVGFMFSFHFLTFFSPSRGYGLSMAFFSISLFHFINYFVSNKAKYFYIFMIFFQLAIAANLIMVIVMLPFLLFILICQIYRRQINFKNILAHVLNGGLLFYWVKFSFFLQNNNALYYGGGNLGYYKTTYLSLIELLFGEKNLSIAYFFSAVLCGMIIYFLIKFIRETQKLKFIFLDKGFVLSVLLSSLIIGFYTLKHFVGINFPEDRTGLFLFILFAIALALFVDDILGFLPNILSKYIAIVLFIFFTTHFLYSLNFKKHSLRNYETIPEEFYTYLLKEQNKSVQKITISAQRVRELFFDYMNYTHASPLNLADDSEHLAFHGDYAIALKNETKDFKKYYDVVLTEPYWNFLLLKRKRPITRRLRREIILNKTFSGSDEFYNLYKLEHDTVIVSQNPIYGEIEFSQLTQSFPNTAWFVFQMNAVKTANNDNEMLSYKRIPLNWVYFKPEPSRVFKMGLTSAAATAPLSSMGIYIYNSKKQYVNIFVKSIRLYELIGNGVRESSTVDN
jgi:hypothetical protein